MRYFSLVFGNLKEESIEEEKSQDKDRMKRGDLKFVKKPKRGQWA